MKVDTELGAGRRHRRRRRSSSTARPTATRSAAPRAVATLYSNATAATANPAVTLRRRRDRRRPGRGVHLRPRPLGRLHAPGQPRLGRAGARRPDRPDPLRRPVLRRQGRRRPARLGRPQQGRDPAGRRAAAPAGEPDRADEPATARRCRASGTCPRGEKAAVVLTGDDHAATAAPPAASTAEGAAARRLLGGRLGVRARDVLRRTRTRRSRDAQARAYQADGFEIALHLNTGLRRTARRPRSSDMLLEPARRSSTRRGRACRRRVTNRTHCIAWSDWATQPKVELAHGIRFDTNYYYWPGELGAGPAGPVHRLRASRSASPTSTAR